LVQSREVMLVVLLQIHLSRNSNIICPYWMKSFMTFYRKNQLWLRGSIKLKVAQHSKLNLKYTSKIWARSLKSVLEQVNSRKEKSH